MIDYTKIYKGRKTYKEEWQRSFDNFIKANKDKKLWDFAISLAIKRFCDTYVNKWIREYEKLQKKHG